MPDPEAPPAIAHRATSVKAQALAIALPNTSPLEIQYLALDLEEGASTERALANLQARRAATPAGGVAWPAKPHRQPAGRGPSSRSQP